MNAPPRRDDAAGQARRRESTRDSGQHHHRSTFRVVVDGKRAGMLWGEYHDERQARKAASNLLALGMHARVEHEVRR